MTTLAPRMRSSVRQMVLSARPSTSRTLSSTQHLLSATPGWQALIGGREKVDIKRKAYEEKYGSALELAAKKEGLSVAELKERKAAELQAEQLAKRQANKEAADAMRAAVDEGDAALGEVKKAAPPAAKGCGGSSSAIKPLNDILDLSKATALTSTAISSLWTNYHQSKGFLSAAIPTKTYITMMEVAKKYPIFVLPLARDIVGDTPEGMPEGSNGAVEMHLLEWAFLPPPETAVAPVPSPSTVLFTPLAEYKSRQAFAQPYLILTHYTDLSHSHDVVLMRGEVSDNVALNATDAQVLSVRLQLFYNHAGDGTDIEKARRELLISFHEKPETFDLEKLVKTAWEL